MDNQRPVPGKQGKKLVGEGAFLIFDCPKLEIFNLG